MTGRRPTGAAVLDGVPADASTLALPWSDPAAQWGLGVFETIAVRDGSPRFLQEHLDRMSAAASSLSVPLPAILELERAAWLVAAGVEGGYGWLKLAVSRSGRWAAFGSHADATEEGREVSAIILPWRRHRLDPQVGIKSLSYAAALLGLEEARRRGADEGLWRNDRGHVVEATTGNVFAVHGRAVVTPALSEGALPGITRARAIVALRGYGLSVREARLRVDALRRADEVFLTSSVRGVRAVVRLDGRNVRSGNSGVWARRLADELFATRAATDAVAEPSDGS